MALGRRLVVVPVLEPCLPWFPNECPRFWTNHYSNNRPIVDMELVQPHSRARVPVHFPTIEVEGCIGLCGTTLAYARGGIWRIERCVPSRQMQAVRLRVRLGPVYHRRIHSTSDSLYLGARMMIAVTLVSPTVLHGLSSALESTPCHGFCLAFLFPIKASPFPKARFVEAAMDHHTSDGLATAGSHPPRILYKYSLSPPTSLPNRTLNIVLYFFAFTFDDYSHPGFTCPPSPCESSTQDRGLTHSTRTFVSAIEPSIVLLTNLQYSGSRRAVRIQWNDGRLPCHCTKHTGSIHPLGRLISLHPCSNPHTL